MLKRTVSLLLKALLAILIFVWFWFKMDELAVISIEPLHTVFGQFASLFRIVFNLVLFFTGMTIFMKSEDPAATMSWLIVFITLPILGFVMYLIIGRSFRKEKKSKAKKALNSKRLEEDMLFTSEVIKYSKFTNQSGMNSRLVSLLQNNSDAPLCIGNEAQLYTDGNTQFEDVLKDIGSAKSHIHVEYYIIKDDETGRAFMDALKERLRAGVRVRLIYDDVGCMRLGDDYFNEFKSLGGEVYPFLPVMFPSLTRSLNYRNHRKILVIDGKIAYIGGMNVGDEYRGRNSYFKHWRDTHLRIIGDSVRYIDRCFQLDWLFVSKMEIEDKPLLLDGGVKDVVPMQIVTSGPDSEWESIMQAFLLMISSAEESIKITSPYFVPDKSIIDALKTAALSGVEVDIIIPDKPDHFFVFWATRANVQTLLEAGVRVHEYTGGFIHSKLIVVDGKISSVGTANFDMRSLKLNFEINAFIYDASLSRSIEACFDEDLRDSNPILLEKFEKRSFRNKVFEALGRLVSPLQ